MEPKQVSLITGASSGIGLEMAKLLARRGHDLVLASRDGAKLLALASELSREFGVHVRTFAVDLAEPGAASELHGRVRAEGLEVDNLINNAGVGLYGEHAAHSPAALASMLQLNVTSLSALCALFVRDMKARHRGRILNVASTAAYQPSPYLAAYGASKSFVLNFSEALAVELEGTGVTVSCLSPGPTDTAFFGVMDQSGVENGHFDKKTRADARHVAEVGLATMFAGKTTRIVAPLDSLRVFSARFAPRSMVARIAKGMLAPRSA